MATPLFYPGAWPMFQALSDPDVPESNPQNIPDTFLEFLGALSPRAVYSYDSVAQRDANLYPTAGVNYYAFTRDTGTLWVSSGTAWLQLATAGGTPWSAYTPGWQNTVGTGLAIGNGTLTGRYELVGKTIRAGIRLVRGSTTNLGGSAGVGYQWNLPAGITFKDYNYVGGTALVAQFNGVAGGAKYEGNGTVIGISSTTVAVVMAKDGNRLGVSTKTNAAITNGWSPSDTITLQFTGEVN